MDSPIISVIVPVYNVEQYLPHCIDSILTQTFTDFEVLLIDDGSTDNSGRICDEYAKKDNRIRVFHKENGGVSSARNVGLDNAEGEFLGFVDGDDILSPVYLMILLKALEDLHVDLVIAQYTSKSSDAVSLNEEIMFWEVKDSVIYLENAFCNDMIDGYLWNKLFKRDIVLGNNIRFRSDISVWEDMLFVVSYCTFIRLIALIDNIIYYYRHRNGSAVKRIDIRKAVGKLNVIESMIALFEHKNFKIEKELLLMHKKLMLEIGVHIVKMKILKYRKYSNSQEKLMVEYSNKLKKVNLQELKMNISFKDYIKFLFIKLLNALF